LQALRGVTLPITRSGSLKAWRRSIDLHTQVDLFISEDAKTRNYSGTTLHRELEQIERPLEGVRQAPAKQAKRLQENNLKLMKVVHATAKTGLTYKTKLGEALTQVQKGEKLVEELTKRGMGWRELAETRKQKLQGTSKQFDTACEALDIMTERYHKDTVELGRRVIVLEFADKAQTPEIQKALKEATKPEAHRSDPRDPGRQTCRRNTRPAPAAAAPAQPRLPLASRKNSAGKPVEGAKITESKLLLLLRLPPLPRCGSCPV
jgi:hypothetical protein